MVSDWRRREVVILVIAGALLEPIGHQLAYLLRYGPSRAVQVQAVGSHAYFPRLASFSTITLALALACALLVALGVRLALGRRSLGSGSFGPSFTVLALIQCALFTVQETAEAAAVQATPDFVTIALLAVCAQLPVAAAAAWLVSRLRGVLALAPAAARVILTLRLPRPVQPIRLQPAPVVVAGIRSRVLRNHQRRGPPVSLTES